MKRLTLLLLLGISISVNAQWYTGMSQKTGLALCIHLTDSAAALYSPMQSADPIPVSQWSLEGDKLTLECKGIGLKLNLTRRDSTFVGYWKQAFLKEDITFYPTDTLFQLRRPQTPQPPYRFDEETVTADYTDSQGNRVHLEGTLSIPFSRPTGEIQKSKDKQDFRITPKAGDKYPCLVLVSGSGQQNRDEEIMQHRPFLVIADYLASRGIAVLRYDDRGVGASGCSPETGELSETPSSTAAPLQGELSELRSATLWNQGLRGGCLDSADTRLFAEDAEAMFNAVKGNPRVDPARLGLGGHSEGGAIAPMVAARNKEVKFVVMLAGQGCTGLDVLLQQNEAIYRASGLSESLLAVRMACMRELFSLPAGSSQKEYKAVIDRHTRGLTKEQVDSIGLGRGTAAAFKQQMDSRWMQTFLTLDPAEYLPNVACPVLALNGSKDSQVLAHPSLDRVRQLCPKADCRELPGLNHLFQHCTTGSPDEYILIEETFAPEALQSIADWILAR